LAKDVLNRRTLSNDQERILNSVLNPTEDIKDIEDNSMNIFYVTAILLCIAVLKHFVSW